MFYDLMWILCTPYSCIMTINLTTQIKSCLIIKHTFIHVIIFVVHFAKHSTVICVANNAIVFSKIFHTMVLGTSKSKLVRCGTFCTVSYTGGLLNIVPKRNRLTRVSLRYILRHASWSRDFPQTFFFSPDKG